MMSLFHSRPSRGNIVTVTVTNGYLTTRSVMENMPLCCFHGSYKDCSPCSKPIFRQNINALRNLQMLLKGPSNFPRFRLTNVHISTIIRHHFI